MGNEIIRPPTWRPINYAPSASEIAAVQEAFAGGGLYPEPRFARAVLETNGGNVVEAVKLFRAYLSNFGTTLVQQVANAAASDHDRGQEPAAAWVQKRPVQIGAEPIGPIKPPDGGPGPVTDVGKTYDAAIARIRLSRFVNHAGMGIPEDDSKAASAKLLARGNPTDLPDDLVAYLYPARIVSKLFTDDEPRFQPITDLTEFRGFAGLQEWLDAQKVLDLRGPSGDAAVDVRGPGGR